MDSYANADDLTQTRSFISDDYTVHMQQNMCCHETFDPTQEIIIDDICEDFAGFQWID